MPNNQKNDLYDFDKDLLPSGITVFTKYLPYATKVNIGALFRVGGRNGKPGLTHFLEHMFSTGDKDTKIKNMLLDIGGEIKLGSTSWDASFFSGSTPTGEEVVLLNALEMLLGELDPSDQEFENEMNVVKNEIANKVAFPELAAKKLNKRLEKEIRNFSFLKKAMSNFSILGEAFETENITKKDILAHYRKYYCTNNLFFFVTGNFKKKEVLQMIKKRTFANYKIGSFPKEEPDHPHLETLAISFKSKKVLFPFSEFGNGGTPQINSVVECIAFISAEFTNEMYIFREIFYKVLFDFARKKGGHTYTPSVGISCYEGVLQFIIQVTTLGHYSAIVDAIEKSFQFIEKDITRKYFERIHKQAIKANSCLNEDSGKILSEAIFENFKRMSKVIKDSMQTIIIDKDS